LIFCFCRYSWTRHTDPLWKALQTSSRCTCSGQSYFWRYFWN